VSAYVKIDTAERIGCITLDRQDRLNAWDRPMRDAIVAAVQRFGADAGIGAVILTGAGDRAFCAGQDLEEAHGFDADRAEAWIREWETYYDALRALPKPLVIALNGTAAGSAFQVALLGDIRIAHAGVRMGQPEINAGIASTTGPWLMREMLGLSRTIELTLTGRMMDAEECHRLGLVHHLVERRAVMSKAREVARELAAKPPIAMRLNKQRFRAVTEPGFRDAINAGIPIQRESYGSGEPARMVEAFFRERAARKQGTPAR
jgi:enoyl-CoA hydratase/carnithine racemase